MDYHQAFAVSAAGMALERTRVDVAAMNLANAHTVESANGAGYRPLRVIGVAGAGAGSFGQYMAQGQALAEQGLLPAALIAAADAPPRLQYEPGHPLADAKGMVAYPGVDQAEQMLTLMTATRAYEANLAALHTARNLALKALDIGGRNA